MQALFNLTGSIAIPVTACNTYLFCALCPGFVIRMQTILQLCDWNTSSSYGAARCSNLSGGCQGAVSGTSWAGHCYPFYIWSGSEVGASSYHQVYEVNSGSLRYVSGTCGNDAYGKCVNSWALSVRCVLD